MTGTFGRLTGTTGQSLQAGTVPAKTGRMVCLPWGSTSVLCMQDYQVNDKPSWRLGLII